MATNASTVLLPPAQPVGTNALVATDIRDVKPPVAIPSWWIPVIAIAVVVALAAAAVYAWRRYRRQQKQPPPAIVIPPYRRALERLRAALDLIHNPERFCVVLSDAVRVYLEERFDLHAPERTTEEFLAEIQASSLLSDLQQQLMGDFLTRCDLVKFARAEMGEPELRELYDVAVRLVEETEPLLNPQATPAMSATPAAPTPG